MTHISQILWTFFAVMLVGCAQKPNTNHPNNLLYPADLLSGELVFDRLVSSDELPHTDINQLSLRMQTYVASLVNDKQSPQHRLDNLMAGLQRDGYFQATYDADRTLTAAQAFAAKTGNCLAFTNMFLALARAAGLDAKYQVVSVPPVWDIKSGFLLRYTHINVNISGLGHGKTVTVDFNNIRPDPNADRQIISDIYAEALFYANESVILLRQSKPRESFRYLRKALELVPNNADLWINLGAFYIAQGKYDASARAYQVALQIHANNKSAYAGMARSYRLAGEVEKAAIYEKKVLRYRRRNPYYHYALSQHAFDHADCEQALEHVEKAIALKREVDGIIVLKNRIEQCLNATRNSTQRVHD